MLLRMSEATIAPDQQEIANELLERMRLLETARGSSAGFWRSYVAERIGLMLSLLGASGIVYAIERGASPAFMFVLFPLVLVTGFPSRRENPHVRMDALIEFLDRAGRLEIADQRPATASCRK